LSRRAIDDVVIIVSCGSEGKTRKIDVVCRGSLMTDDMSIETKTEQSLTDSARDPALAGIVAHEQGSAGVPATDLLIAALREPDVRIRRFAADVLGEVNDPRAVDPLIASLKDPDRLVGQSAIMSLAKLGDARAVAPLVAALKDGNQFTRRVAVNALGAIGDAGAIEPLIAALDDQDGDVREAVCAALKALGYAVETDQGSPGLPS
jgi:HEAT repeat protein